MRRGSIPIGKLWASVLALCILSGSSSAAFARPGAAVEIDLRIGTPWYAEEQGHAKAMLDLAHGQPIVVTHPKEDRRQPSSRLQETRKAIARQLGLEVQVNLHRPTSDGAFFVCGTAALTAENMWKAGYQRAMTAAFKERFGREIDTIWTRFDVDVAVAMRSGAVPRATKPQP